MELGAGHGRLAFHILQHLEILINQVSLQLPPYCYVLSDIVEDNLEFFDNHPQFQPFFEQEILDVAYFDAVRSKGILLRHSDVSISTNDLKQPLLVIANYFFDSIPNDLFHFRDQNFKLILSKLLGNVIFELIPAPHTHIHIYLCHSCIVLLNRIICQMGISITQCISVIILKTKSNIKFIVEPYFRGIIVFNDNPYSDVKFSLVNDQRILYVFLNNILSVLSHRIVQNL